MPKGQYVRKEKPEEPEVPLEEVKEEPKVVAPLAQVATVERPKAVEEPKVPTVEVTVEGATTALKVYPQIRCGVCEFHGAPYGVVNMQTLTGRCSHFCPNDPICPHSKNGCPKRPVYRIVDGEQVQVGVEGDCRHNHNYNGLQIRCSYCPRDADMRAVIKSRVINVYGHPDNPNKLIMVCSDYRCRQKHLQRFNKGV